MEHRAAAHLPGPLLVDLYELTMADAYLREGIDRAPATFSLFTRRVPRGWGHLVSAGIEDVLAYLGAFAFTGDDLAALERLRVVSPSTLRALETVRFTGDVRAMPEGTPFTADEPVLEVDAPILEAQLVESAIVNLVHLPVLAAAKASRCVEAARGRRLVDFALRRTHGADAAMRIARAAYLAGFDATSNVEAGLAYDIPVAGTMAHSYIQAHPDEAAAFTAFLDARPGPAVLLVDTYDTLEGVRTAIRVTRDAPSRLGGVRLDSGDMLSLSLATRAELDQADRTSTAIFLSGGLDEHEIARLLDAGAPADAFGVGTRLGVVADSPALDMAYKLVAFDGAPSMKRSAGKATWPGPKQVWRVAGPPFHDVIGTASEEGPPGGVPLLHTVMRNGCTTWRQRLPEARARLAEARANLPTTHRGLDATPIPRRWSPTLERLRDRTARRLEPASG